MTISYAEEKLLSITLSNVIDNIQGEQTIALSNAIQHFKNELKSIRQDAINNEVNSK